MASMKLLSFGPIPLLNHSALVTAIDSLEGHGASMERVGSIRFIHCLPILSPAMLACSICIHPIKSSGSNGRQTLGFVFLVNYQV